MAALQECSTVSAGMQRIHRVDSTSASGTMNEYGGIRVDHVMLTFLLWCTLLLIKTYASQAGVTTLTCACCPSMGVCLQTLSIHVKLDFNPSTGGRSRETHWPGSLPEKVHWETLLKGGMGDRDRRRRVGVG